MGTAAVVVLISFKNKIIEICFILYIILFVVFSFFFLFVSVFVTRVPLMAFGSQWQPVSPGNLMRYVS